MENSKQVLEIDSAAGCLVLYQIICKMLQKKNFGNYAYVISQR